MVQSNLNGEFFKKKCHSLFYIYLIGSYLTWKIYRTDNYANSFARSPLSLGDLFWSQLSWQFVFVPSNHLCCTKPRLLICSTLYLLECTRQIIDSQNFWGNEVYYENDWVGIGEGKKVSITYLSLLKHKQNSDIKK